MALQKEITAPNGKPATYWKIQSLFISRMEKRVQFILFGYENEAARTASEVNFVHRKAYNVYVPEEFAPFDVPGMDVENPVTTAYNHIKAYDPDFVGVLDV